MNYIEAVVFFKDSRGEDKENKKFSIMQAF
jgi:hypothetical protein